MATAQSLNFVPTSISGCSLWLDAADRSALVLSGSNVSQWNDKSGNGRNTTTTYGTPQYRTTGFNSQLPTVYFTSNSGFTGPITNTGTTVTAFVVGRLNTVGNPYRFLSLGEPGRYDFGTTTDIVICTTGNATTEFGWYRNVTASNVGTAMITTVYNSPFVYTLNVNGSTGTIVYNGSTTNSGTTSGSFGYSTYGVGLGFTVSPTLTYGYLTDGFIAEILVYTTSFTLAQRQQVEGYLAWKWGLQGNLPATHPYKLIAPNSQGLGYPSQLRLPVQVQSVLPAGVNFTILNPRSISGCVLWLDGTDPNGTGIAPAGGATVSTWVDKSGIANNATGGSATYQTNRLFGLPGIVFAGNTAYTLAKPTSLSTGQSQGSSLFVIVQSTGATSTEQGVFAQSPSNPGACDKSGRVLYFETNLANLVGTMYCGFAGTANAYAVNQVALVSDLYTNTGVGNYTHNSFLNGTAFTTTGSTVTGANTSATIAQVGTLNFGTPYLNGVIYEILYYNNTLSTSQRQLIEGYLAWKWGLTGSLPANHPYKQNIPGLGPPVPLLSFGMLPASFTPRQISGLQVWFDASDLNGNGTNPPTNSVLSAWADKSSNSYGLIQPTAANQPTYTTPALNGFGGVQFASNTWLYRAGSNMTNFATGSNTSVFMALRNASGNTSWNIFHTFFFTAGGTGTATARYHFSFNSNTSPGLTLLLTNATTKLYNASWVTPPLSNAIVGFTVSPSFTTMNWNGNLQTGTGVTLPTTTDDTLFVFQDPRGIPSISNCIIYEMVGYNTQLTQSQTQSVEGYLAWKWGLQGNLPTTHPFRRFPPPPN